MSALDAFPPACPTLTDAQKRVDALIIPRAKDLGGFEVRRALPAIERRMIGPFVFLDRMGPAEFPSDHGIEVRPHPHIGLSTLTWLFEGEILHRDSLGSYQPIRPGEVNWMTAGQGVVHSERSGFTAKTLGQRMDGLQAWVALPKSHEDQDPLFFHAAAAEIPLVEGERKQVRVIAGAAWGAVSPVPMPWPMLYAEAVLAAGSRLPIPTEFEERGIYVVQGQIRIGGEVYDRDQLLVLHPGEPVVVEAMGPTRMMVLAGEPLDGPRHLWWNFVASSKERLEDAKQRWLSGAFPKVPGDEQEFIPLPGA